MSSRHFMAPGFEAADYGFVDMPSREDSPLFDLKYCSRCCMPETEEGYNEDAHGMCRICQSSEQKMHIDWTRRRQMLEEIVAECKTEAGSNYDCMVPISGGKDSTFQLYILTQVFKMKPLAVTYSHNWFSKTGWYNLLRALKEFDVDHIMFTPHRSLVNGIAKKSLQMIGDSCWSCHAGVGAFPLHVAVKYRIPVIIYGESVAEVTQRGDYYENKFEYDKNYYTQFSAKKSPSEMICDSLSSKDLFIYQLPSDKEYEDARIRILHLGDFIFWDDERQMEFTRDNFGWRETDIENAYKGYKSAECIMPGVHDFTCYLKRGWARAAFHASLDVRNGILTREEGFRLINSIDPQRPEVLDYYLKITGMSEAKFYDTIRQHKEPSLRDQVIPILPKAASNRERLLPYPEQLIEEYVADQPPLQLQDLCFTCGLELAQDSSTCVRCDQVGSEQEPESRLVEQFRRYAGESLRKSGDNYDCILLLDETWECVYLLHLVKNIYKLKPLVISFDEFAFTRTGRVNLFNSLETFNVDQIIFTPSLNLSEKLREQSRKSFNKESFLHELGLFAFMIKTACEFGISTVLVGKNSPLKRISQPGLDQSILRKVDFAELQDVFKTVTESLLEPRDIHLLSVDCLDAQQVRKLNLIAMQDLFDFGATAKDFVQRYYCWQPEQAGEQPSFALQFVEENQPGSAPGYFLGRDRLIPPEAGDYGDLSIANMVRGYASKAFTPVDIARAVIGKIENDESFVNAWTAFDADSYLALARDCEAEISKHGVTRVMQGVPVGVKDIFNTKDFPTQMGSPLWEGFTPGNDARAVYHMKRAGALICGKTVTSEFAVHALNKTVNPHCPERTPGTSSSGSAASIAMGMVPVSLGTQSGASIIRPASFCGVYGFKPSYGLIPRTGILKTTDTLDNVGFFVRYAEDLENVFNTIRLHGSNYPLSLEGTQLSKSRIREADKNRKIAFARTHTWDQAEDYAREALTKWIQDLSGLSRFEITEVELPRGMEASHELHSIIYDYCLAYYFSDEFESKEGMTARLQGQIEHGKRLSQQEYQEALDEQASLARKMNDFLASFDAMVSLSTAGEAPLLGEGEKSDPGLMWTLTNQPSVSAPAFKSPHGLPFGLQLTARRYSDLLIIDLVNRLVEAEMLPPASNPITSRKSKV